MLGKVKFVRTAPFPPPSLVLHPLFICVCGFCLAICRFHAPLLLSEVSDSELQSLREAFDASAVGGVLSRAQLAAVLSDIGFGPVPSDRLFDLFDADGNGKVRSIEENRSDPHAGAYSHHPKLL